MSLEDATAFSCSDYSVSAEAVPMVHIMCLSDIWLPSHLLQNRGKIISSNLNKPGIFHTLEKPVITDCFSVYSESNSQINEFENCSDNSSDELSQFDMLDILNDYSPTSATDKVKKSFNNEKSNFLSESLLVSNQLQNCSPYQQSNLDYFSEVDAVLNSQEEEFSVNRESGCLEKIQMQCDLSDTNNVTIVRTFSESLKDSLEEVYNSEDEYFSLNNSNLSQQEIYNGTDSDVIPVHRSNTPSVQLQKFEIGSLNDVSNSKEKQQSNGQSGNITVVGTSDCCKNLDDGFNAEKLEIDDAQNLCADQFKYSVPYQKPVIEECVGGKKKQKLKKKKALREKKTLLKNPLFDASEDNTDYYEPEVDHFYEHVMQQERRKSYASEFPSLHKESKISYIESTERIHTFEEQMDELMSTDVSTTTDVTYEQTNEMEIADEHFGTEYKNEGENSNTIVIENIPLGVTDDQLHSILLDYGELKNFSIKQCGEFLKAELRMDSNCEVEWMIEGLNGNQPFGTTTKALKCYKLC